jgi:DNA gyrase subunit A
MAGISAIGKAIYFDAAKESGNLVTAANSSASLGRTDAGSVKLTPLKTFPKQGRGSKGVRCHKFLKNEDQLYFARFTNKDTVLFDEGEKVLKVPAVEAKRDGSGNKLSAYLAGAV